MKHIKYFYNYLLNIWAFIYKKKISSGHPPIIILEPTNICTMDCVMCVKKYMKRPLGFMDFDLFKKIIDQTKDYTHFVTLHLMGDPCLHPDIDRIINYLHKKNILSELSINPTSLSNDVIDKILNSELDLLIISLDGIDNKTYKKYRGKNADYNLAVTQLNRFLSRKIKLKKIKPYTNIRMLALPGLEKYLSSFKKQWQKPGVDKVSTKSINTFGGSIKEVNGKKNEDIKWDYQGVCWEPWHGLHILWDGKVVPCCWDYDGKYILGDLNKQTLEEIWNGKKMQELRKQCATNNFTIPICVKCTEKIYPEYPLKHIIDYIYQRNQTKKIVKTFKRIYNRLM